MVQEFECWPGVVCYECGSKALTKKHLPFDSRELYSYVTFNRSKEKRLLCESCKEKFLHQMLKYPELQLSLKIEPFLKNTRNTAFWFGPGSTSWTIYSSKYEPDLEKKEGE